MLSKKQNLLETIHGGRPDRFVNQFEAFAMLRRTPVTANNARPRRGGPPVVNDWGVTMTFPDNTPGAFPVHDDAHKVIRDITHWRDTVKAPRVRYPLSDWKPFLDTIRDVDPDDQFVTATIAPGIFEQCHHLMSIMDAMVNLYEAPDEMHELIEYLTQWELDYAEEFCRYVKPTALFHHDDWGSMRSSFMSPEMFREFIVPAYQKIYGCYKAGGVEIIVHHSDSYAANLVPHMIDMGIDIWQGCSTTNDVPALIAQYGGKISFMGNIDSGVVDTAAWTPELIQSEVRRACRTCGKLYFIPNATMGGPSSVFPGVYEAVSGAIDEMSREMF